MHTHRRTLAAAALTLVMALVASGCGGGDDDEADTTTSTRFPPTVPVDNQELTEGNGVCAVLTRAEVEAAVGMPADAGRGVRTRTSESCKWQLRGGNDSVNVIATPEGVQLYEGASTQLTPEPLPGVGDRAFVANDTVYALKGNKLVILQVVTRQAVAARRQAAVRLMQTAITRA